MEDHVEIAQNFVDSYTICLSTICIPGNTAKESEIII